MKIKKQNSIDITNLCRKLGIFIDLLNGFIEERYPFYLFTTTDLCCIGGFKLSAAPRLAHELHAAGFSTVPNNSAVRDLIDPVTRKKMRGRVWFMPKGRIEEELLLRSRLNNVASVRKQYNNERAELEQRMLRMAEITVWRRKLAAIEVCVKAEGVLSAAQRDRRAPPNVRNDAHRSRVKKDVFRAFWRG